MSTTPKKGFSAFIRPPSMPEQDLAPATPPASTPKDSELASVTPLHRGSEPSPERVRHITSTGRVRTHTANRMLPGVTLRLSEDRWERLKMLSIQERRPIQDILGDAMDRYMKGRGLPW